MKPSKTKYDWSTLSRAEWVRVASEDATVTLSPRRYKTHCLAYFDLLGFSSLVKGGSISLIASVYERSLTALNSYKRSQGLQYAWFSDTFLIYSADDSWISFAHVQNAASLFLTNLLLAEIPVRGAISVGKFLADRTNRVYLGEALLEAYSIGEAQDWIGAVFCPSVLIGKHLPLGTPSPMYPQWKVVFHDRKTKRKAARDAIVLLPRMFEMPPYALGIETALVKMQREVSSGPLKKKYQRTLEFIRAHEWFPK